MAKDRSKPFIINLPNRKIQVTGTSFNINTYDNVISKIALVEGGVNFISGGKKTFSVKPGTSK